VLLESPAQPSSPLAAPNKLHPCFLLEQANSIYWLLLDPLIEHTAARKWSLYYFSFPLVAMDELSSGGSRLYIGGDEMRFRGQRLPCLRTHGCCS
jgi:hypothetical protein